MLIPISVVWIVAVAAIRVIDLRGGFDPRLADRRGGRRSAVVARGARCSSRSEQAPEESAEAEPFDAFAGGYPVPPMPVPGPDSTELDHRGGKR